MDPRERGLGEFPSDEPGRALFEQFSRRLIGLARAQLDVRLKHRVDPEDIVQSVYKSFFRRYGDETIATQGSDGLWSLLTLITLRKCADRARYYRAERRNIAQEAVGAAAEDAYWLDAVGREPTPDEALSLAETVEEVLGSIDADERPIIELSLQGYSTQEISERLGRAERSVRRLRERVRKHLERMQDG